MAWQTRMRSFRDSRFRPRNRDTQKDRFPWTLPAAPGTRNPRRAARRGARRQPRSWGFPGSWSPRWHRPVWSPGTHADSPTQAIRPAVSAWPPPEPPGRLVSAVPGGGHGK